MRHVGGDIEKVSGAGDQVVFESVAIPHSGFAAEHIDRGFVIRVLVHLVSCARRDSPKLQMNSASPDRLCGDSGGQQMSPLAAKFAPALTIRQSAFLSRWAKSDIACLRSNAFISFFSCHSTVPNCDIDRRRAAIPLRQTQFSDRARHNGADSDIQNLSLSVWAQCRADNRVVAGRPGPLLLGLAGP